MIDCVRFDAVEADLASRGFARVATDDDFVVFEHRDGSIVMIHPPNEAGAVPEALANDAYDTAGLDPPRWRVEWCD